MKRDVPLRFPPKIFGFFCNHHLAFSPAISIQSLAFQLYRLHSCQLQASSPSLVTAVVLQLEIAGSGGMQNGGLKESRMKVSAAFRPRAQSLYLKMSITQYRNVRATLIRGKSQYYTA